MWFTLLLATAAALANVAGAALMFIRRSWSDKGLERLLAFGAGFLLALALLELIPETLGGQLRGGALAILLGFLALHTVERLLLREHVHTHHTECDEEDEGAHTDHHHDHMAAKAFGKVALLGMVLHTFFDGVSISAGLKINVPTAILVFAAVLLHKIPDGLVIASVMLSAHEPKAAIWRAAILLGLSTVAGAVFTALLVGPGATSLATYTLGFSGGIFLYVAASDLIPEVNQSKDRVLSAFVVLGMILFYLAETVVRAFV